MDKRQKSIAKAISWRVIATLTTVSLVFIYTKELSLAAEIGVFEVMLKMLFYYLHERGWNRVKWGNGAKA